MTRSLEAYRAGDAGGKIDHVVVGGDVGVEEALAEALQKRLGVTTELYNPASTFGWEPDEGAGASAFAASLGLVLSHAAQDEAHFDFLHPKKTESIARKRLKKAPMVAAVVVVFLAAGGIGFAQYTKPGRERLAKLEHRIRVLQRKEKDFNKFLKLYEQVASFERSQVVWVDVLYDVFSLLPPNTEMLVTHLETNQRDRRLTLKTRSKHRQTPTDLVLKLEAFRREGATKPRFRARVGPQVENDKEKYPFAQDIRIWVLNDGVAEAGERAVGKSG
ncbi:MAG: hypothetical protein D6788_01565 [Planctomycetota bacterium]|nr:MAG: hypothetical protein D6788_01565 [Planctomycetota bacterium]